MATSQCHQNKLGGDTNHLMVRKEGSSVQAVARGATRRPEPAPAKAGVKLLAQEGELYVLAQSRDRVAKSLPRRRPGSGRYGGAS